ncbi:unnamed protein product, partial [Brenthis ino]
MEGQTSIGLEGNQIPPADHKAGEGHSEIKPLYMGFSDIFGVEVVDSAVCLGWGIQKRWRQMNPPGPTAALTS